MLIGKTERYYPLLITIRIRDDVEERFYLEDVMAWARGDFSTLGDIDEKTGAKVSALAQLVLDAVRKMEGTRPPGMRRIECREDDDLK